LGKEFDLFHVYPSKGHFFLQDRIEYTGINLKVGLRGDVFFPGRAVERLFEAKSRPGFDAETAAEWDRDTHEIFGRRYKIRWSPRLAVSHPISDRSHFFFNFGRFTQWPSYYFLYAKTGGVASEELPNIGNPNLEPEVSAQYEFGAGHKLTERFSLRATVFFKDIYDYPTSIPVEIGVRSTRRQTFFIYRNLDYARSRGFELELQKRRDTYTWFGATYSYSVASGKSSDPNALKLVQSLNGDARETDLEEQFMWWNRPHKITLSWGYQVDPDQRAPRLFGWRLPKDWKLSLFWMLQSGEAYTPESPFGAELDKDNSRNGPWDSVLDLDLAKNLSLAGRRITLSFVARNLLNHRTVLEIDPSTGYGPRAGVGQHWGDDENPATLYEIESAIRETDSDPSAFESTQNSVIRTLTDTMNPAFISAPRTLRFGISYDW
jgi:outer membrane receptor protein involved in Fe transport